MKTLVLENVNKYFGCVHAVKNVSFAIEQGEFVTLLGPSGCGKTTTLRMVAGFERVSSGVIKLADKDITSTPPFKRNTGMVFQSYALFPHMNIEQNIGFGLRMRGVNKDVSTGKVQEVLELIQLSGYENRMPRELSGGQQQRVALARALAIEPAVLLLDEPLSNLDAKLREEMRIEIKRIQQTIGITALFVTHDQEEALTLSDRIVVMNEGAIEEIGTPYDIYSQPQSAFTGMFLGHSNVLHGQVVEAGHGNPTIAIEPGLQCKTPPNESLSVGDNVVLFIRQERVRLNLSPSAANEDMTNRFPAEIQMVTFLGPTIEYICKMSGHEIRLRRPNEGEIPPVSLGQKVEIEWSLVDSIVLKE